MRQFNKGKYINIRVYMTAILYGEKQKKVYS